VAGAIRRRVAEVDELVLVAIPQLREEPAERAQGALFAPTDEEPDTVTVNALWTHLDRMTEGGAPRYHGTYRRGERWGERHRQFWWEGYPVELYATTLDSWGHILLVRTGPASFTQRYLATLQRRRFDARDGRIFRYGKARSIPDERDAFRLLDWTYRRPGERE